MQNVDSDIRAAIYLVTGFADEVVNNYDELLDEKDEQLLLNAIVLISAWLRELSEGNNEKTLEIS